MTFNLVIVSANIGSKAHIIITRIGNFKKLNVGIREPLKFSDSTDKGDRKHTQTSGYSIVRRMNPK
jgi:hypothetical protein